MLGMAASLASTPPKANSFPDLNQLCLSQGRRSKALDFGLLRQWRDGNLVDQMFW